MAKIDASKWKPFAIGSIFDVVKGTRLTKAHMVPGTTRFIGSSAMNNGCTAMVGNTENVHPANTITVCYNGSVGETFYQDEPFLASDDVNVLYPRFDMSRDIALFIIPLIKAISKKYNYIDKWKQEVMILDKISLPVDSNGEPDWAFMNSYMSEVMRITENNIEALQQADGEKHAIDVSEWQKFVIGDLFEVSRPITRSQAKYEDGDIPFVASGNYNNGVTKWCTPKSKEVVDEGNCITVSPLDGSAFYQKEPFLGRGGAGSAILMLRNENMTELSGLFISSVIRQTLTKYTYSDQLNIQTISEEQISLPVNTDGEPDWKHMETHMSEVIQEAENSFDALQKAHAWAGVHSYNLEKGAQ